MIKLNALFSARQYSWKKYLQPNYFRYLSVFPSNDSRSPEGNNATRSKKFHFWTNFGVLIGTSYVFYNFYQKRKSSKATDQNDLFKNMCHEVDGVTPWRYKFKNLSTYLPAVQAAESTNLEESRLEKEKSPRAMFSFLADVADKTASAVVYIEMHARHPVSKKDIPISNGSGFIIKSDGLILTNAHVVSHHGNVKVKLYDGSEYDGKVEHYDTESDLATVRIEVKDLPVLPLGQSSKLRTGEFVIAMGNPLTLSHTITAGVISSANRAGKDLGLHKKSDYIQTDAAVNVGNSGGPLVNLDCEAIGINTMKVTEGISFAIPSDRAVAFLKRIEDSKKNGEKSHVITDANKKQKYLGITMLTLTPSIIRELQERNPDFPNVSQGVLVWRVMVNSPSYESGIKPGDVITAINDTGVKSASEVYGLLKSEDILSIHIVRRKKEFDIIVKPMDPV